MAIVEIAVSTISKEGKGRQIGDIVCCRKPIGEIGKKELTTFIWFLAEVQDELAEQLQDPTPDKKRRYSVALSSLKGVDVGKALNPDVAYQPFVFVDSESGRASYRTEPVKLESILVDSLARA